MGEAVIRAVMNQAEATVDGLKFELWRDLPKMDPDKIMKGAFVPFFPEYQNGLEAPEVELRRGAFIFKAMYHKHYGPGDVWRELAVPHHATLHDLYHAVIDAFDFWDDEHLYDWHLRDRSGRTCQFVHPGVDRVNKTDRYADEASLGELDLPDRGILNFTFDYGHTWRFVLQLQRIDPPIPEIKLIESHGKSLPQYPSDGE